MNAPNRVLGRILRGNTDDDFTMLSDAPLRTVVLLFGDDGFELMRNLSPYEQLRTIGYSREYIHELVTEGHQFRLIAFPQEEANALPGTWENIVPLMKQVYPNLAHRVTAALIAECMSTPFAEFERTAGFSFSEVRRAGIGDPRYMTSERFLDSAPTALNLRRFLYHSLHLRELYRGDGYTWQDTGIRGVREFFMKNMRIEDIKGVTQTQLEIVLPPS